MCHANTRKFSVSGCPLVNGSHALFGCSCQNLLFFPLKNSKACLQKHFYDQRSIFRLCFSSFAVCISSIFSFLFFAFQFFSFYFQFFPSAKVNVKCMKLLFILQLLKKALEKENSRSSHH